VYENADLYGIQKDKIALMGSSGGGWISLGASILMAR
jgi:acetyl esterase/lipase